VNKTDIHPTNVQIHRMKEEGVHAIKVIDSMDFGAPLVEYYQKRLGSTVEGAGITGYSVAGALTQHNRNRIQGVIK
jgi:hypothetical protein